ncbi:MAG: glycosyltransferase family 4 protein [Gemmatimonadota bacterium]
MHDILFAYDFPPLGGGIARMMEELARGYPAGELVVSTGSIEGQDAVDRVLPARVDRIAVAVGRLKTLQGRVLWSRRAVRLAREPGARFVWCGTLRPAGYPAQWAWKRTGLPYGVIFYGGDLRVLQPKLARSWLKRRAYRPLFESASVLVAISAWTATLLADQLRALGLDHLVSRIHVVGLGTSPERFRADAEAAERFRVGRGLPEGRWFVTVARLVPHKGIDTAIRVLAQLAPEFPELRYAVIGRGGYLDQLQRLATELGVHDRVHFLTDVTDNELPGAYAMGEIYLGLSREVGLDAEGFGISLLEAAATELPVVAGASGGIADAVADGETGLLVAPGDVEAAVGAVRHLLANRTLAHQLGAKGRQRVLERFTWDAVVTKFRRLAAEHGRP